MEKVQKENGEFVGTGSGDRSDGMQKTVTVIIEKQPQIVPTYQGIASMEYRENLNTSDQPDGQVVASDDSSVTEDILHMYDYDYLPPPRAVSPAGSQTNCRNSETGDSDWSTSSSEISTDSLSETEKSEFESFMKEILDFNWESKVATSPQLVGFDSLENLEAVGEVKQTTNHKSDDVGSVLVKCNGKNEKTVHFSDEKENLAPEDMVMKTAYSTSERSEERKPVETDTGLSFLNKVRSHTSSAKPDRSSRVKRKGFVFEEEPDIETLMQTVGYYKPKYAKMEHLQESELEIADTDLEQVQQSISDSVEKIDHLKVLDYIRETTTEMGKESASDRLADSDLSHSPGTGFDNPVFCFDGSDGDYSNLDSGKLEIGNGIMGPNRKLVDVERDKGQGVFGQGTGGMLDLDFGIDSVSMDGDKDMLSCTEAGSLGFVNDGYLYDEVASRESSESSVDIDERHVSFASLELKFSDKPCHVERSYLEPVQTRPRNSTGESSSEFTKNCSDSLSAADRFVTKFASDEIERHFIPVEKDETDIHGKPFISITEMDTVTEKTAKGPEKPVRRTSALQVGRQLEYRPYYENSKQELVEELKVVLAKLQNPENRFGTTGSETVENKCSELGISTGAPKRPIRSQSLRVGKPFIQKPFSYSQGDLVRSPHYINISTLPNDNNTHHALRRYGSLTSATSLHNRDHNHEADDIFDWFHQKCLEHHDTVSNKKSVSSVLPLQVKSYSADNIADVSSCADKTEDKKENKFGENLDTSAILEQSLEEFEENSGGDYDYADNSFTVNHLHL